MRRGLMLAMVGLALAACGGGNRNDDGGVVQDDGGTSTNTDSGTRTDGGPGPSPDGGVDGGPTCTDGDGDGYGDGCALGADCDDSNAAVSPAATEVCNGVDDNCDGNTDEDLTGPSCELTDGVCAGAVARCGGADGFLTCDATDYGDSYEATETLCDGLDNDCDGSTDENCTCSDGDTQACGSDVGACMPGTQTCSGGAWGACDGDTGPMGEVCDGLDNDCDGSTDDAGDLTPPACPLQLGVCAGSHRTCGGVAGWIACSGVASYGGDYQASETLCDGLDNDCDGVTDDGCECVDGSTQACGSDIGACMAGTQTCTAGAWGACAGEVPSMDETCNGVDDDCDGTVDDGLTAPSCALQDGVCAGSHQRCSGAGGFVACVASDYGSSYEATETMCDGLDNDCNGVVDEGCTCVDGDTQECGSSTGVCERGMQTCSGGDWGACVGSVDATAELCNGLDDDCNGSSDDGLTAPACALTEGVCAGSTQTCGGASGWTACSGTDSYGPSFVASEDGSTDESVCDGLDNDCNGTVDDNCASGPIVGSSMDEVLPSLHNQHLAYLANYDGNWDVVFANLTTGETRRLTSTSANEHQPKVYGNYVIYLRGEDAAARAVLYDLTDDSETVINAAQTLSADIYGGSVVYDEYDGTQWDIFVYDIAMASASNLFMGGTTNNEVQPSLRGNHLAYLGDASGTLLTYVVDVGTGTVTAQTPASMSAVGETRPVIDYSVMGWSDGRNITSTMPTSTDNWDVYGAPYAALGSAAVFPGENALSTAANGQILTDIDGQLFAWSDYQNGNWDPAIGTIGGTPVLISTNAATQADPTVSGNVVFWEDNRLGNYDIYGSALGGSNAVDAGYVVINQILADPPAGADVNGDGTPSTTQDEMVEIVNATGIAIDVSGMTLSDSVSVRHTFPDGTVIPALGSLVVFGGGSVGATSLFGGAIVQIATGGSLSLNNSGDTLTLTNASGTIIDTVTYGSEGGNDQSLVRSPEVTGTSFVQHSTATGSIRALHARHRCERLLVLYPDPSRVKRRLPSAGPALRRFGAQWKKSVSPATKSRAKSALAKRRSSTRWCTISPSTTATGNARKTAASFGTNESGYWPSSASVTINAAFITTQITDIVLRSSRLVSPSRPIA